MGIFSDLIANAVAIDTENPIAGPDLHANLELERLAARNDVEIAQLSDYAEKDEVQSLAPNDSSSGNFTLTFTLASGETFTTGNLAFNVAASQVVTAIDSAATTASVAGWTNGDISAIGGNAATNPIVFTFDGDSVSGQNHGLIVATDVDLDDGTPGTVTVTTNGQADRNALAALAYLGEVLGTPPNFGDGDVGSWTLGAPGRPNRPGASLVNALLREASHLEGVDYTALYKTLEQA